VDETPIVPPVHVLKSAVSNWELSPVEKSACHTSCPEVTVELLEEMELLLELELGLLEELEVPVE
jgi:hypothetical protein